MIQRASTWIVGSMNKFGTATDSPACLMHDAFDELFSPRVITSRHSEGAQGYVLPTRGTHPSFSSPILRKYRVSSIILLGSY